MRYPAVLLLALLLGSCGTFDEDDDNGPGTPAQAEVAVTPPPAMPAVPPEEQVVVTDANGMTVYYHDRDQPNRSSCNNRCAQFWFPVRPSPEFVAPGFDVITRLDRTQQVTFKGKPLYTFHKDQKPGDMKGDGNQNIWHALRY